MPDDRRFDPHWPRRDYRRVERFRDFDAEWRNDDEQGERYFGTGSHYGGGFGTAPGSYASGAGASGAPGYASRGAWTDADDWTPEEEAAAQPSFRGRGPKGYTRSDERLLESICERLTDDPRIDASDIEVEVKQQVVTLRGTVSDRRSKYAAEELVEDCGARDIDNQLRVSR